MGPGAHGPLECKPAHIVDEVAEAVVGSRIFEGTKIKAFRFRHQPNSRLDNYPQVGLTEQSVKIRANPPFVGMANGIVAFRSAARFHNSAVCEHDIHAAQTAEVVRIRGQATALIERIAENTGVFGRSGGIRPKRGFGCL